MTRPEAWLREGRRVLDAQRAQAAAPIPGSREKRLAEAKRRLDEQLAVDHAANRSYEMFRATGRMPNGGRLGAPPKPFVLGMVRTGR